MKLTHHKLWQAILLSCVEKMNDVEVANFAWKKHCVSMVDMSSWSIVPSGRATQ